MTERWAPIPSSPGYEASDFGNIRSVDRTITCKDGRRQRWRGRVLRPGARPSGHVSVVIAGQSKAVHRLVLEAFAGPCPPGFSGCHWDDNPKNNALSNLRWDTHSANMRDIVRNGNHPLANRTHCPRGHRLELPNLVANQWKRNHRYCKACHRAQARISYMRRTGKEVPSFQAVSDAYYSELMRQAVGGAA